MRLREHMHAQEVTDGVNDGRSFDATFPDASGGITEVHTTLDAKARFTRQYETVEVVMDADTLRRYLDKATDLGCFAEEDRLFRTPEGDAIDPEDAQLVHRRARLAHDNMDGQGGVCDALHEARRSELARQ